ncbi:phage scaffolding protein [Undibacterium arcticum]
MKELRAENKGYRLKAQELEGKLKTAEESVANAAKDTDTKVGEANKSASERILRAELKVKAKEAGLIDMDGLKLADLSKVSLKDDGSIDGADALFAGLKEAKPYLFGAANSSTPITPPPTTPPAQKLVKDMTPAEYAVAKAALLK